MFTPIEFEVLLDKAIEGRDFQAYNNVLVAYRLAYARAMKNAATVEINENIDTVEKGASVTGAVINFLGK